MADRLRIAVIGVGQIGKVHLNAYKAVKNADVVAVVDILEDRAKEVKETYGVPDYYVDYKQVLERDDIDAIDICVPTYVHEEVAVATARAGKHFLCEKPMTLSMASADRMLAEAEKAGVTHMVAFCRRFDNEWNKMRELIQAGVIGRPVVWRSIIAVRGGSQPWFVQKGYGDGPLIDGAIHNYDFARFMFGEATQVVSSTKTFRSDATAIDTGSALIAFDSGDDLLVSWSWGMPKGAKGGAINDIIGPKGILFFARNARPDFKDLPPLEANQGAIVVDHGEDGGIVQYPYTKNNMYTDEIQEFVNAILEGRKPTVDGFEGRRSLAVACGILDSGELGKPIVLSDYNTGA